MPMQRQKPSCHTGSGPSTVSALYGLGTILMRASSDPMSLADQLRRILNRTPRLTMLPLETLEDQLSAAIAPRRFQVTLLVSFGALTLVLAMVGAYGVLSFAVTRRTQEVGVRMALGATRRDLFWMILKGAGKLVIGGVAIAILASPALTRPNDQHALRREGCRPMDLRRSCSIC
jgi:putative ABC transport system permease protein